MTDIKRAIAGVDILADTRDPEKAKKVQTILDAAMKALSEKSAAAKTKRAADFLDSLIGRR